MFTKNIKTKEEIEIVKSKLNVSFSVLATTILLLIVFVGVIYVYWKFRWIFSIW